MGIGSKILVCARETLPHILEVAGRAGALPDPHVELSSMMNVHEAREEPYDAPNAPVEIDEIEVKEIIESIKEAQYFDASSMAPLTPTSLVSSLGPVCD